MNVIGTVTSRTGKVILTNARLVLKDEVIEGSIHLCGGMIESIDKGKSQIPEALDCGGDYVIPGLVDLHTDNLEKHLEPRPGVNWPVVAALQVHDRMMATAGVTTVFDSLVAGELTNGKAGRRNALKMTLDALSTATEADMMKAEHFFHIRCELPAESLLDELDTYIDHPIVKLVSLMDHTPGQRQWTDLAKWKQYNSRTHSEADLDGQLDGLRDRQARYVEHHWAEVTSRCRSLGLPLASHDDTTKEHVEQAFEGGIMISEFPTTVEAAETAHALGMKTIMGSPNVVLGGSHSGNVGAGHLAELGLLDALSSDYVPISMIQSIFILADQHGLSLPDAVNAATLNPAQMVGLEDRGELTPGKRADVVRVQSQSSTPVVRGVWCEGVPVA